MPLKTVTKFLKQVNELKEAEVLLDTFAKYSQENFQYDELAQLYYEIKRYPKSAQYAEKSLLLSKNPNEMFAARANLAKVYNHMNEPNKALKNINLNLMINPNDYEAKMERIFAKYLLGKYDECEAELLDIIAQADCPADIKDRCYFNLATYKIGHGRFKEGFADFTLYGKKVDVFRKIVMPEGMRQWDGFPEPGKKILLLVRGGIGDEIINVRFMKNLKDLGMEPVWQTANKFLAPVFNRNGFKTIINFNELPDLMEYEYYSCMDLPYALGLEKEELGREPYLFPDAGLVEMHKEKKGGIGIKWAGNPEYEHDLHRTLPLEDLMTALVPTMERRNAPVIYSLQKEDHKDLSEWFDNNEQYNVYDLSFELNTIESTLAIIWNLDLVITSCTSIAHMAGAMGKRVIVLPPISCYYVWLGRDDGHSDWYGDYVTTIRQTEWRSWEKPLEKLKSLLESSTK